MARLKRRPNNTGSIIKKSGKRSKPYAIRITTGTNPENGRQIQKEVAFFADNTTAIKALEILNMLKDGILSHEQANSQKPDIYIELMKSEHVQQLTSVQVLIVPTNNPTAISNIPTLKQIFDIIFEERYQYLYSEGVNYISWFKYLYSIKDKQVHKVTFDELQDIINDLKVMYGRGTMAHVKSMIKDIYKYAQIKDYIDSNQYAKIQHLDITLNSHQKIEKDNYISKNSGRKPRKAIPFTDQEIDIIKQYNTYESKILLMMIYSGMRPKCLFTALTKNVHMNEISTDDGSIMEVSYLIAGSKTDAGKDRIVPIHPIMEECYMEFLRKDTEYLVIDTKYTPLKLTYKQLYYRLSIDISAFLDTIDLGHHIMYDCRHTFITLAKRYHVDDYARKRIVGHKAKDITDDVYTATIINMLYKEMLKIK